MVGEQGGESGLGRVWHGEAGELRGGLSGGINSRGRMSGENAGRPGRVPLALPGGGGTGTGQQLQIQPERDWLNEGVLT